MIRFTPTFPISSSPSPSPRTSPLSSLFLTPEEFLAKFHCHYVESIIPKYSKYFYSKPSVEISSQSIDSDEDDNDDENDDDENHNDNESTEKTAEGDGKVIFPLPSSPSSLPIPIPPASFSLFNTQNFYLNSFHFDSFYCSSRPFLSSVIALFDEKYSEKLFSILTIADTNNSQIGYIVMSVREIQKGIPICLYSGKEKRKGKEGRRKENDRNDIISKSISEKHNDKNNNNKNNHNNENNNNNNNNNNADSSSSISVPSPSPSPSLYPYGSPCDDFQLEEIDAYQYGGISRFLPNLPMTIRKHSSSSFSPSPSSSTVNHPILLSSSSLSPSSIATANITFQRVSLPLSKYFTLRENYDVAVGITNRVIEAGEVVGFAYYLQHDNENGTESPNQWWESRKGRFTNGPLLMTRQGEVIPQEGNYSYDKM